MNILYEIGVVVAKRLLKLLGIFSPKIQSFLNARHHQILPSDLRSCIWIHCASLGEFEQGRPVIEAIKLKWPDKKIVLTFFSSSGFDAQKNYQYADWVGFLPIDTKNESKKFMDAITPSIAIFVKYEFWYNHLDQLITNGIPFIFISSYWWKDHFLLRPWNQWLMNKVKHASAIFVQDQSSKDLLTKVGYENAIVAGDTRIDRVLAIKNQNEPIPYFQQLSYGKSIFIAGSTWPEDEKIIKEWLVNNQSYRLIIVPHDVSESRILQVLELFKDYSPIKFSDWNGDDFNILVVNKIGLLNKLYAPAQLAYIGGGFGKGIHNTLEAVVYGIPVLFGPKHKSFREAMDLIDRGIGYSIENVSQLSQIVHTLTEEKLAQVEVDAKKYITQNKGATELIINYLSKSEQYMETKWTK